MYVHIYVCLSEWFGIRGQQQLLHAFCGIFIADWLLVALIWKLTLQNSVSTHTHTRGSLHTTHMNIATLENSYLSIVVLYFFLRALCYFTCLLPFSFLGLHSISAFLSDIHTFINFYSLRFSSHLNDILIFVALRFHFSPRNPALVCALHVSLTEFSFCWDLHFLPPLCKILILFKQFCYRLIC